MTASAGHATSSGTVRLRCLLTTQATLRLSAGRSRGTIGIEYSGARYPIVTRDTTASLRFPKSGEIRDTGAIRSAACPADRVGVDGPPCLG